MTGGARSSATVVPPKGGIENPSRRRKLHYRVRNAPGVGCLETRARMGADDGQGAGCG